MIEDEPSEMPAFAPLETEKRGCITSFLNGKRNEMNTLCDASKAATGIQEYIQPDKEKEAGGEA